uniref:Uncharacterized protein n=1 Tax=Kalanchoe fedtschenkoi TaxID=63787 RepID=A0A7N0V3A5_KALFE
MAAASKKAAALSFLFVFVLLLAVDTTVAQGRQLCRRDNPLCHGGATRLDTIGTYLKGCSSIVAAITVMMVL